ncbi:MAG: cytochrome c oxidase subunit II [Halorientalis sp.]
MHVHNYEKLWLGASLLLIVGFISTIVYGAAGAGVVMVNDEGGQVNPNNLGNTTGFQNPGVTKVGPHEYEVHVIAYQFAYQPATITIPANSTVTFYVTSRDVIHGFEVVGTNVNTMVIPGQVSKITAKFDEPGSYGIICNEYCGAAHHSMAGELIVKKPSNFTMQDTTQTPTGSNGTSNSTQTATATPTGANGTATATATPTGGESA